MNRDLPPSLIRFEAQLEAAIRRELEADPAAAAFTRRRLPRRLLAAAAVPVAGLAAALILLLGTAGAPPAFAITRNADGTVTVRLTKASAIAEANQKLASMGIRAEVVVAGPVARYLATLHLCAGQPPGSERTVTFDPASIPTHQTLVLGADRAGHFTFARSGTLSAGQRVLAARLAKRAVRLADSGRRSHIAAGGSITATASTAPAATTTIPPTTTTTATEPAATTTAPPAATTAPATGARRVAVYCARTYLRRFTPSTG